LNSERPLHIVIWRCTRACNYNCLHCSFASTPKPAPDELDTKGGLHVVDEIYDFGATWFGLSGGEPLMRKDIFEIISHARDIGLKVSLITNGSLVNGKIYDNLVKNEVRTAVSLDGSERAHDLLRGKGRYKNALSAIQKLSKAGILDCLVVTTTKFNYKDVDHVVDVAGEYGARWVVLHNLVPVGKAKEHLDLAPSPQQYEWLWNHVYDLNQGKGKVYVNVYCPFYARVVKERGMRDFWDWYQNIFLGKCTMGGKYIGIVENGDVRSCGFSEDVYFGNIMKKSLKEFWDEIQSLEFYEKLRDFRNLKGKCGVCEYREICGGCRTRAEAYTGDFFESDPACAYIPKCLRN
jgi:radical SAM protein with 4Fe4S-binding SPASM domain